MGENDPNPITGGNTEGVSDPTETPASGGVAQTTPAQPTVDVEKLKAEYEGKLQRYQSDLNAMKSSLQKREAQVNTKWQERYDTLQDQMHQTRMATMTDDERAKYEHQLQGEEMQSLQRQLAELQGERQTMAQSMDAMNFFLQQGVPANILNLTEGYDALVRSGWNFITEELTRLRQAATNPQQPQKPNEPNPLPTAPSVVTDKSVPAKGTTWAALRERYGSDEAVYRAVEENRLPASIIPD